MSFENLYWLLQHGKPWIEADLDHLTFCAVYLIIRKRYFISYYKLEKILYRLLYRGENRICTSIYTRILRSVSKF
jgi:hypothetical protein